MTNAYFYPRYAMFGNGYDTWEVDILHGNALRRGFQSVENVEIFTAQKEIAIYKESKKKKGEIPTDTSIAKGYGFAKSRAIKKLKQLEEVPIRVII